MPMLQGVVRILNPIKNFAVTTQDSYESSQCDRHKLLMTEHVTS